VITRKHNTVHGGKTNKNIITSLIYCLLKWKFIAVFQLRWKQL